MIFRKLRTALTRDSTDDRALENNRSMENLLSAYFFARILQRNMSRTGQASLSGFVLGIVILLGRIIPKVPVGAEDSWLLSSMVTAFALYMIVVVVWNVAQILNPDVLEEFERSGDEFLAKYSIN